MGQFDIGLSAKINQFATKYGIIRNNNDSDVFESFSNFVVSSVLLEEELENVESVSTNNAQGIDGIVIIVNNRLITEESDLQKIGVNEKITIKIGFIQTTIQKSFDNQKFRSFTDEVVKFLTKEVRIEPFSSIYDKLLDESGQYISQIEDTPRVSLFFVSGKTNHNITDDEIEAEEGKINNRSDLSGICNLEEIKVLQTNEIKQEYDKIPKFHTVQLKFDSNIQITSNENDIKMGILSSIKFSELKKLILTKDGLLKDRLFVENVRNYIGETIVNRDIKNTLDDTKKRKFFQYLNNGLIILCDDISRAPVQPDVFKLNFPRIINGCQTTNTLYRKFKEIESSNPSEIDDVEVIAKVIATDNEDLKKSIIFAANNQNSIEKDLQSLNDFHEKIEQYFQGTDNMPQKLFFERLRGQYPAITPPYCKINIENLARVYISVFLQEPEKMKSNALTKIDEYQKLKKIFNDETQVDSYYYCAVLNYWFNKFIVNRTILMKSKTMDMHLLMACDLVLDKKSIYRVDDKIQYLSNEDNAMSLFDHTCNYLNSKQCYFLFERRGFYSNPKTKQLIESIRNSYPMINTDFK